MVKFESLKVGNVLYECRMQKQQHVAASVMSAIRIEVIDVYPGYATIRKCGVTRRASPRYFGSSTVRRFPQEFARYDVWTGRTCFFCHAREEHGHTDNCKHPKAVAARKKAINK